jgi:uncharacterized membrane protein (UPF0127 family)
MSRRKDVLSWGLIVLVLFLVAGATVYVLWPQLQPHTTLHLGDGVFTTQVAKTQDARDKALSGTHSLGGDQAELLVYPTDGMWSVSMQYINYPVDIVWLNKDKQVVYIVKNVSPDSYPYQTYMSKEDARYVVEVVAGTVDVKSITIGSTAVFDENTMQGLQL